MIIITSEQNKKDFSKEIRSASKEVLYLGQWCKSLDDKDFFINQNIIDYHWCDYNKREKDLKYIESLYQKILICLTKILNDFHGTSLERSEAEIFYGLWLKTYLIVAFDRWEIIDNLLKKNIKFDLYQKKIDSFKFHNADEFIFNSIQSDDWNDFYFQKILGFRSNKFVNIKYFGHKREVNFISSKRLNSKKNIFKLLDFIFHKIFKYKKNINFSYLDINNVDYLKLILKIKNFSSFDKELNANPSMSYDYNIRKKLSINMKNENDFERFIFKNIFLDIPTTYIENFTNIHNFISKFLVQKNNLFLTTHGYANREEFQLLVSLSKKKYKSKLYIIQHGSGAIPKYNTELNFSEKISDKFLRSGINKFNISNHKPFGQIFYEKLKYSKSSKNITLLLSGLPRRTLYMRSIPLSSGLKDYFSEQINLVKLIQNNIYKNFYIKFYPTNYWNEKNYFLNNFKDLKYYEINSKIKNISEKTKLFINTSTFTPHNQLISSDIPCIFFWDRKKWLLTSDDEHFHQNVLLNKIYFESSTEVAKFINKNYDNIFDWWNSKEIRAIVKEYQNRYAYPIDNKSKKIFNLLKALK